MNELCALLEICTNCKKLYRMGKMLGAFRHRGKGLKPFTLRREALASLGEHKDVELRKLARMASPFPMAGATLFCILAVVDFKFPTAQPLQAPQERMLPHPLARASPSLSEGGNCILSGNEETFHPFCQGAKVPFIGEGAPTPLLWDQ